MEEADNPYAAMEGYTVYDASGVEIGEIESTVYDAPSDVLKYVVVDGRPVPAEAIAVDPDERRVSIPFDRETVESAPRMESFSGAFDDAVQRTGGTRSEQRRFRQRRWIEEVPRVERRIAVVGGRNGCLAGFPCRNPSQ